MGNPVVLGYRFAISNRLSASTGTSEPISFTFIGRTRFVFTWSPIGAFLAVEIAVVPLPEFRV